MEIHSYFPTEFTDNQRSTDEVALRGQVREWRQGEGGLNITESVRVKHRSCKSDLILLGMQARVLRRRRQPMRGSSEHGERGAENVLLDCY